jgi:hypothetical protein
VESKDSQIKHVIGEACSSHGDDEKCRFLVQKRKQIRPLGRYRRRWDGNIKMVLTEKVVECGLDSWAQDRYPIAGSCDYGNEPFDSIKDGAFLDQLSVL